MIARMLEEHLDDVIALGLETEELHTETSAPQFYSKPTLKNWIKSSNGILLVALVKRKVVGFSLTAYNPDSRDGYLHAIALKKDYRGKEFGKQMVQRTIKDLVKMGCNHFYNLVQTTNEKTIRFMERNGFEKGKEFVYMQRVLP